VGKGEVGVGKAHWVACALLSGRGHNYQHGTTKSHAKHASISSFD
jgi:hypothetical protein